MSNTVAATEMPESQSGQLQMIGPLLRLARALSEVILPATNYGLTDFPHPTMGSQGDHTRHPQIQAPTDHPTRLCFLLTEVFETTQLPPYPNPVNHLKGDRKPKSIFHHEKDFVRSQQSPVTHPRLTLTPSLVVAL